MERRPRAVPLVLSVSLVIMGIAGVAGLVGALLWNAAHAANLPDAVGVLAALATATVGGMVSARAAFWLLGLKRPHQLMTSRIYQIARQASPCCGYPINQMTNVDGMRTARPGDPIVCIACGHWLTIDDQDRLRILSPTEAAVLSTEMTARLEAAAAYIEHERQAGRWTR
jgi:hypothetical protein